MTLAERMKQLQAMQPQIEAKIAGACKAATMRAVEKATEMTPPTKGDLAGTNTRTGEMKQHWATDSETTPAKQGNDYTTLLANNMQYASYVNDGHRMDRHFVPGLNLNEASGLLEYDPSGRGGIMVGTRTQYVEGLFMEEAAHEEYHRAVRAGAESLRRLLA